MAKKQEEASALSVEERTEQILAFLLRQPGQEVVEDGVRYWELEFQGSLTKLLAETFESTPGQVNTCLTQLRTQKRRVTHRGGSGHNTHWIVMEAGEATSPVTQVDEDEAVGLEGENQVAVYFAALQELFSGFTAEEIRRFRIFYDDLSEIAGGRPKQIDRLMQLVELILDGHI